MKFNNIEPRTREERAALKDKEKIEEYRLKQRIGGYHKYVDNAQVNQPDPISSHYLPEHDRFDKDFAAADKKKREEEYQRKLEAIERKRVEKFERDLQRWKYMDEEENREKHRLEYMNDHYLTGNKNKGGAAYNVISLDYDNSNEGQRLKRRDDDAKVRALVRSKNIDMRSNCGYNVLTGDQRSGVYVPPHETYNPYEHSNATQKAGKDIVFGGGADRQGVGSRGHYEESKAQPPQEYEQQYNNQQDNYNYQQQEQPQSYNQAPRTNSRSSAKGGVQLPIASKNYEAFGGNAGHEGAGVGGGYSQPMQQNMQPTGFEGGAGTKFY